VLSVTPKYPRGFENFKNNSVKFIEWLSAAPQGQTTKVKLEFSSTGSSGPWSLIADSLPNNGRFQWRIPPSVNSSNCFIRYTAFVIGGSTAAGITPNPFVVGNLVGIGSNNETPEEFRLFQNYPNPFNPETNIEFQVSHKGHVSLKIYDLLGKEIAALVNGELNRGTYKINWEASNYPSGIYFVILESGNLKDTKKIILLK
jgi:hypothetical protein